MKTDTETCLEVIKRFHGQISWADKTKNLPLSQELGMPLSEQIALIMVCTASVYFPVHWSQFDDIKNHDGMWEIADNLGLVPTFLIFGEPDRTTVERIWREGMAIERPVAGKLTFIHVTFVDIKAAVYSYGLIGKAMDGIDWGRSFEAIAREGSNAKPVYRWDD